MLNMVLTAVVIMGCLGLILGLVIGFFAKLFKVETDSRVELVTELLPGANCGGCGKAGCADFAKSERRECQKIITYHLQFFDAQNTVKTVQ